ncbi:hypothetical protein CFP75_31795 [Amycolatopsis alba DSM 44262]|uniref:Uncharacterized protein n=1 Tax=Amycolatopsis alba DSM 44262 TaxID=1125972 RepID=A0A229REV7_AMYAL|nr:hypothetical protein CFP75_31795 [Amycolatopsis alba DSM 44262]
MLGLAFCLLTSQDFASALGLPLPQPWFLAVLIGIGCFVFSILLVRAVRGRSTATIVQSGAIANAAAAVAGGAAAAMVPLHPVGTTVILVSAAICATFAVLEWHVGRSPAHVAAADRTGLEQTG